MGSYTFDEFKQMLRLELEERSDLESHSDLGNLLGKWINAGYLTLTTKNRFWGLKRNFYFPELETVDTSQSTTDGTTTLNVPADCLVIRHLFDETNDTKLDNISMKKYLSYTDRDDTTAEGEPTQWVRFGSSIYLYPTPDDTYSMYIYYRQRPAELTGTDATSIGAEWDEVVLKTAVIQSLMRLKMYDEAEKERVEWMDMVQGLIGIYDDEHKDRKTKLQPDPMFRMKNEY